MPYLKFAILLALLSSAQVYAENEQQILIRADSMKFDINAGSSVYRGNVSFVQAGIKLSGDVITVNSKDGSIDQIKVEGSPAHYSDASPDGPVLAESASMDYSVSNHQLSMQGEARLEQGDRVVQSQHIIYDTDKKLILAGQPAGESSDPEQRVNITLTPKKDRTP